jgi:hypothetical protein
VASKLYFVTAPHFSAGFVLTDGMVTAAAPILRYMKGKGIDWVLNYCRKKKWNVENVREDLHSKSKVRRIEQMLEHSPS